MDEGQREDFEWGREVLERGEGLGEGRGLRGGEEGGGGIYVPETHIMYLTHCC